MNSKVFKKMGFHVQKDELESLVNCKPQAVERMLQKLQQQMARCASHLLARGPFRQRYARHARAQHLFSASRPQVWRAQSRGEGYPDP